MNENNMREALEKILLIAEEFGGLVQKHISPIATKALTTDRAARAEPVTSLAAALIATGKAGIVAAPPAAQVPVDLRSLSAEDLMQAALHASRKNLVAGTSNWAEFVLSYLESRI